MTCELEKNVEEDSGDIESDITTESISDTLLSNCAEFEQELEKE